MKLLTVCSEIIIILKLKWKFKAAFMWRKCVEILWITCTRPYRIQKLNNSVNSLVVNDSISQIQITKFCWFWLIHQSFLISTHQTSVHILLPIKFHVGILIKLSLFIELQIIQPQMILHSQLGIHIVLYYRYWWILMNVCDCCNKVLHITNGF